MEASHIIPVHKFLRVFFRAGIPPIPPPPKQPVHLRGDGFEGGVSKLKSLGLTPRYSMTLLGFVMLLCILGAQATVDLRNAAAMAAGLCSTKPTDVVFIIDSSRSVRPSEFEQVKVFMTKVIDGLTIGPDATRVGVVNYASRVKNEVSLKSHKTKAALVKAVSKIEPLSTGTMTGLAIQFAMNVAFTEAEGARKSPGISKVAIIVTDGRPQDNIRDIAARAREAGIEIFAIGVGRVDMTTLRQMASEPLEDHVDYVESYSLIEKLTKKFQEAFCGKRRGEEEREGIEVWRLTMAADIKAVVSDLCATGDHDCEHICISTPGSFKCACREGFTLQGDGRSCSACSNAATDVVFVIDGSKSVRPENFELVKKWINQIIDKLDVSETNTHVGLVQYSSTVKQEFPLGRYNNKKALKDAVKKMDYMERGTMTGHAISFMVDNSFSPNQGARPGVEKVGIVFTDGRSQDYIGDAARKAKENGFKMYAVGVGNAVEDELREIASEPVADHYFYTADFKTMNQIAKKLQINVCQEEDPCECNSVVKFQKKVEEALQALTKKYILSCVQVQFLHSISICYSTFITIVHGDGALTVMVTMVYLTTLALN
ncbi:Cartilage matrix protein [Labeo rohita]|uniref:Cartilage matrix protein n=1 Tax=Labeo rohita TaxID=84645 RepID=A0ABQ8LRH8_LABRO|nr:Cartilage matrix protein [Labeo rohita]